MVVATFTWGSSRAVADAFQSLAGFLGRCDFTRRFPYQTIYDVFQSLAGFLGRCDYIDPANLAALEEAFQSLAGFLGRCDLSLESALGVGISRFNPWRVFLVVATLPRSLTGWESNRFNPWRVFLVVATFKHYSEPQYDRYLVSIPGGFSWSLRREDELELGFV